jgi:hypothetical protein
METEQRQAALGSLKKVGGALVAFAALQELLLGVQLVISVLSRSAAAEGENLDAATRMWMQLGQAAGTMWLVLGLLLSPLVLIGALRMRSGKSRGLALTAAIASLVPFTCTCLAGMPLGVWALIVLFRADVRALYAEGRPPAPPSY